jgi:uncharacterized membrane protein YagU involved in acid resistance
MNIAGSIIAGLVATAVMTLLMYTAPRMGMPKMDIIGMLGSMFSDNKSTATVIGLVVHFVMGVIFAIVYAYLWSVGVGSASLLWGLIFGLAHGVIAIVTMPMMMRVHPRPPAMKGGPKTMVGQLMGHAAFGLVVAMTYAAL